ncbi:MAG: FAD-dependent oxidoreductase [Caldilineales bacterium]|nr:FAD-dependent oxidoreductase [Caldilineales bacterium]MCW5857626.1 FAD-dependent oxidoreductase [Caldilineales bacterium]
MPDNSFPTQAQVVIIGGGVGGASIAYHLTQMGWRDVVVLERNELTSGSTFHSAGLVGTLRTDVNLTKLIRYSTDLYRRLKDETGVDPGWREVGSLRLASSPKRLVELKRQVALSRSFGLPLELIGPQEAQNLFPIMVLDDVEGAVYLPTDGFIDPNGLTFALAAGAKAGGARFLTQTRVQSIEVEAGRVRAVTTDRGRIETEVVVNAAGQWAGEIGRMVGLSFPIIPMAHLYLITEPIAGVTPNLPTMRDPDLLIYYRQEVGGLVAGGYERQPKAVFLDGIPRDFNNKLLAPDWERFTPLMENLIRRVPALETAGVRLLLNGPEGFTPDGEYLLGPTTVKGFWMAAAFCAHGLAGAGGIGKALAEWISDGHTEWNLWKLDVRRFGSNYASQSYTLARTIETYAKYYDIHYPNDERHSVRPLRLSPAYHRLNDLGAVFGEKTGWERPNWFESNLKEVEGAPYQPKGWSARNYSPAIEVEHLATRARAGLFDATSFSKFEINGPGALALLQALCANDIDRPIGSIVYTQMLNPRGGIECDFTVTRLGEERFRIITGTAFGEHDRSWIRLHAPDDGSVRIDDVTSMFACIGLWGPRARAILQKVTRADVSNPAFPYMTAQHLAVGDVPVLAARVTYVGELGWELYAPMEYGQLLWETLWGAGQDEGLVAAGYRAIESLRLEKGYRYWSGDIGPDYTPYEAGLGFAVRLDKGEFIGRPALLRQRAEGIRRRLCCLTLADSEAIVLGNEPIWNGNQVIGWVSSGGYGYSVRKSIVYAYLPVELSAAGHGFEIELFGEQIPATVVQTPLWDAKGERVRA